MIDDFLERVVAFLPATVAGDVSFLLIFVAASIAAAFFLGRTRLISVILYAFVAFAFVQAFPTTMFSFATEGRAMVFIALLILFVAMGDFIVDIHIPNQTSDIFFRIFITGLLASGLIFSLLLSLLSRSFVLQFLSAPVAGYFSSPGARAFWMALPILFLFLINRRRN